MEIIELKNAITRKTLARWAHSIVKMTEERISESDERSIKFTQSDQQNKVD